jgi:scyllo-inositol 2-dehydrogenase (NADP+)
LRRSDDAGQVVETRVPTVRAHWDEFYRNIAEHLSQRAPLTVSAEAAREVVRVLEAAVQSYREHSVMEGPWGDR